MNSRLRCIGMVLAIAFFAIWPCVGQSLSKIAMLHSHGGQFPGKGTLELSGHGIAWTEQQGTDYGPGGPLSLTNGQERRSLSKHSFSVSCEDIRDSALNFPRGFGDGDGLNWIILKIPSGTYKFESTEGYSSAVLLDQIKAACHLGEPTLE